MKRTEKNLYLLDVTFCLHISISVVYGILLPGCDAAISWGSIVTSLVLVYSNRVSEFGPRPALNAIRYSAYIESKASSAPAQRLNTPTEF